jgi:hypothetical protein
MGTGITTTTPPLPQHQIRKKDIDSVVSDTNNSSGPPVKERLTPPSPFTPVKEGRRHYRLLMPIIGAAVAAIIVLVLVSSSMQHPSRPPIQPTPNPTNIPPTVQTANGYSFIKKRGSNGTLDGQFYNPQGVVIDSNGFIYEVDSNNSRLQKFDSNGKFIAKWGVPCDRPIYALCPNI